jgi:uncharacterized protein YlzI (FlbEa/FlbD family)
MYHGAKVEEIECFGKTAAICGKQGKCAIPHNGIEEVVGSIPSGSTTKSLILLRF